MGGAIGQLLPLAVGVAVSPIPIIAVILMLLSRNAGAASVGFAVGWILGIVVATVIFLLLSNVLKDSSSSSSSTAGWTQLVLGVLLLLLAVRQWRQRPKPGEAGAMPKWMAAIEGFNAVKGGGLGFLLSAVNPKNLLMCISAGVALGQAGLSVGQDVVVLLIFTVIAASTVLVPVIGYAVAKTKVTPWLNELRDWLQQNNVAVMAVLFLVIGVSLVGKGIGAIS